MCTNILFLSLLQSRAEVSSVPHAKEQQMEELPNIPYGLFGTVNHVGHLEIGHYVANVKIRDQWYHCNDSYIGREQEQEVLHSEGAYMLFYQRQPVPV
jgi:ubiquitin C-terminal hydrolase